MKGTTMKLLSNIKTTLAATILLISMSVLACWYQSLNYNDYIATVNGISIHSSRVEVVQSESKSSIQKIEYGITNNIVVDFPVTVTMKLTSEEPIMLQATTNRREMVNAKLQYRTLPNGDWTTVSEYSIETGRLPETYPPAPYLGQNNIFPAGSKKGDKIMVRLYVKTAWWQSGDLSSKCDETIGGSTKHVYEQDRFNYIVERSVIPKDGTTVDLGGGWLPHYVVVLTYSGYTRPVK